MAYQLLPLLNKPHSNSSEATKIQIDFKLAQSIIDRLGYTLEDLSLEYGDVVIPSGDISHQLWYDSTDNACTIMGYVWIDENLYYTDGNNNYKTAEEAALALINPDLVKDTAIAIQKERQAFPDYM